MHDRILIVDDEPAMLHAVERVLRGRYELACCRSPAEALERHAAWPADLALLDVQMPGMSGFGLMDRLRERQPDLDVIFMTGSINELDQHLIRAIERGAFHFIQKPFDRAVLLALIGRCLGQRHLSAENRRHVRRIEQELLHARAFQQSLLPAPVSRIAALELRAAYVPCDELCGDLYDYAATPDHGASILIADVSGHGAPAAMLTGVVKSAFHAASADGYEPLRVIERVAAALRPFPARRFVTAICAKVAPGGGKLTWVNAGHPPGVLINESAAAQALEPTGPLLCSQLADARWESATLSLRAAGLIVLYTDGLESVEPAGGAGPEIFGSARVRASVEAARSRGAVAIDQVVADVRAYAGNSRVSDDLTLIQAEWPH